MKTIMVVDDPRIMRKIIKNSFAQLQKHSQYVEAGNGREALQIIMVTSESAKYNVIEALKAGATDYIIKPVNERKFHEKLLKIAF